MPYRGSSYGGTAQFHYRALSRPSFLYFRRCKGVSLENVTLQNSPSWTVHLLRCKDARVENVTIRNPLHGPNTDGIDINSSIDVLVRGCDIITGDDGVVLKSTEPGHDHPSQNITVEDCRVWSACNCLKLGTETHDRFDNIVFRKCHLYSDSDNHLERPLSGVAIESVDGAHLSNITVSDITMDNVRAPLFVRLGHRGGNSPRTQQVEPRVPGRIDKVVIRNITARHSMFTSSITGIPGHYVSDISLENVELEYEGGGNEDWALGDVPDEQVIKRYPEAQMFGRLPAYGLYCRHVKDIRLDRFSVSCLTPDPRPHAHLRRRAGAGGQRIRRRFRRLELADHLAHQHKQRGHTPLHRPNWHQHLHRRPREARTPWPRFDSMPTTRRMPKRPSFVLPSAR